MILAKSSTKGILLQPWTKVVDHWSMQLLGRNFRGFQGFSSNESQRRILGGWKFLSKPCRGLLTDRAIIWTSHRYHWNSYKSGQLTKFLTLPSSLPHHGEILSYSEIPWSFNSSDRSRLLNGYNCLDTLTFFFWALNSWRQPDSCRDMLSIFPGKIMDGTYKLLTLPCCGMELRGNGSDPFVKWILIMISPTRFCLDLQCHQNRL